MPTCPLCPWRDFVDDQAVQQHRKKHKTEKHKTAKHVQRYSCDKCAKEVLSQQALDQHRRDKHPILIQCTYCDRKFATVDGCQQHEQAKHTFPCPKCDETLHSLEARQQHEQIAHPPILECRFCDQEFTSYTGREQHILDEHTYLCPQCNETFHSREAREQHERTVHPPTFECTYCDREFTTVDGRQQHEQAKHTFPCPKCAEMLHSPEARQQHEQTVHPPILKCIFCSREFTNEGLLDEHKLAVHAHRCYLCPRDFGSSQALQQHRDAKHPRPSLLKPSPVIQAGQLVGTTTTSIKGSSSPASSDKVNLEDLRKTSLESRISHGSHASSEEMPRPAGDVTRTTPENAPAAECQCTICERANQPCPCPICKRGRGAVKTSSVSDANGFDEAKLDDTSGLAPDNDNQPEGVLLESESHYCGNCLRTFEKYEDLQGHTCYSQDNSFAPHCPHCYTQFRDEASFQQHVADSQVFLCALCGTQCCSDDMLREHLQTHPTCQSCGKSFVSALELCGHVELEHPVIVCWDCEGAVIYQASLEQHYADSPDHPSCVFCGMGMKNMDLMDNHINSQHATELRSSISREHEEGIYDCDGDDQTITVVCRDDTNQTEGDESISESSQKVRQERRLEDLPSSQSSPHQPKLSLSITPPSTPSSLRQERNGSSASPTPVAKGRGAFGPPSHYSCPSPTPSEHGSSQLCVSTRHVEETAPCSEARPVSPESASSLSESSYYDMSAPRSPLSSTQSIVYVSADAIPDYVKENRAYLVATSAPSHPSSGRSSPVRLPSAASSLESLEISPEPAGTLPSAGSVHRLHCRICHRDPCEDMTATICGHIFCKRCITQAVVAKSECPVCKSATLLYCLFRLDLTV